MKPEKDIFDLFRENEHKLSQRPSSRAWERLESRMDARKSRHQVSSYRTIAWAACIVALLSVTLVMSTYIKSNTADSLAMAEPMILEDISQYSVDSNTALKAVEYSQNYDKLNNSAIIEGSTDKKLKAVIQ